MAMDWIKFLGLLLFAGLIDVAALDVIRCPKENENVTGLPLDGGCDGVSNCQQTRLCQAVVGLGLVVECSVCSLGDNVSWVTPQEGPHMSNNRTLTLNVSQTVTAKGYFNCSCGSTHQNMSFNVTVENKATPNVTVHPESMVENNFTLPSLRTALNLTHGDRVCLNMSTTGYPTPMYTWSYHNGSNMNYVDISTNPCFSQPSYGMLCVLPTRSQLLNTGGGLDLQFRANVTNVAGYITLFQHLHTDVSDSWYIKAHPDQSSGSITLNNDGVGTAWCAAYSELNTTLNFSVCIMNDSYTLEEQACLFVSDQLECHTCASGYTSQNLNLTAENVTDQLGFKVALCGVSSSHMERFLCIAGRKQSFGPQIIGSFEFTFNNNKSESFWKMWGPIILGACGGAVVFIILLIVVIVAIVIAIVICKRCRRRGANQYRRLVSDHDSVDESAGVESGNYNSLETSTEGSYQRRAVSRGREDVLKTYPPGSDVPMTDQNDSAYGTDEHNQRPPSRIIQKGSVRSSSPVSSVADSIEMPRSAVVNKHEAILEEKCWVPFGIQSHHIRPEGGSIFLVPDDTEEHKNLEAIKIEVPKDAVNVPTLEIRLAVIVNGPFSVPDGHKLASMVVYVYFDPHCISKPLLLHLPNWVAKSESLSPEIVIASHSFDHMKGNYEFKFENISFSRNGAIPISGHCSLFSKAIDEKAVSSYYLTAYQSVGGDRNKVDVLVTYESDTWIRILRKYRFKECSEMMGSSLSFRFKDDNDRLKMRLKAEKGPGWSAAINNPKKSIVSQDVDISRYGEEGALKCAVKEGNYPPGFVCDIRFIERLRRDGEPHHLCLEAVGGDFMEQPQFLCLCYQEKDFPCAVEMDRQIPDIGYRSTALKHVPLNLEDVTDYVDSMAYKWARLGNKLGVFSKVAILRNRQEADEDKCLQIIESAVEEGTLKSWDQLLEILRSDAMKMSMLAQRIEAEMSEKYGRERQDGGSVEDSAEHGQLTYADIGPNESPLPQLSTVKEMHEQLIRSLNIDAPLLAAMNEKGLLSQVDLQRIQAMLSNGTARCDIASYFINNILLRWAPGVFVGQLELFRDALADHDDSSNNQFAEDFTKIMKEHLPSTDEFMDAEESFDH